MASCAQRAGRELAARPARRAPLVRHRPSTSRSDRQGKLPTCRAVAPESGAEWLASSVVTGGTGGRLPPPLLLADDLGQVSHELQELCRLQLQLLTATLKLSLQAVLTSSISASISGSFDEECLRQQLLLDSACLRSTVYCRAPASLQTGQLQLQLVSDSEGATAGSSSGGGGGSTVGGDGGEASGDEGASGPRARRRFPTQQAQRFLFLGQDGFGGASMAEQERWIVEQQVIVLPDSGGLVLPLASNGFLVGLLVVERCLEDADLATAAAEADAGDATPAAAEAGTGGAQAANGGAAAGAPPRLPQPPTCLEFRSSELQLLKQTAAVLALACAIDLRAALDRAGAAYRQRQASALVQAAKKPLSMMRTLGTMLLPRLQPGEPDRDFAQGILEQGSRLQEVVTQLQAALHPSALPPAMPPMLQLGTSGLQLGRPQLPGPAGNSTSWQAGELARPALPSSTIGDDYQAGLAPASSSPTIDLSMDTEEGQVFAAGQGRLDQVQRSSGAGSRGLRSASGSSSSGGGTPVYASRASADLLNVLMPLLASASTFAAVSGVTFVMTDHSSSNGDSGGTSRVSSRAPAEAGGSGGGGGAVQQAVSLPAAEVAVGPGKLKRMLSQLIDGIIACAARGDLVRASVLPQAWQGQPGVAITLCCCYSLTHGGSGGAASAGLPPRPPLQPEFAFLQGSAAEAGGWFEVHAEPADVRHLNSSTLAATLWLPTVGRDAAW